MTVSKNLKTAAAVQHSEEVKTGLFGKIFGKSHSVEQELIWASTRDIEEENAGVEEYHNPMLGIDETFFDKD